MSSGWAWLALLPAVEAEPDLTADAGADGVLCAWRRRAKPVRSALRCDARILDPDGPATAASLVLVDRPVLFDDPAVQEARRLVLAWAVTCTTLLSDDRHFRGSLVWPGRDDPFRLVGTPRALRLGPGLLRPPGAAPAGPTIERYGSTNPWPWDRFA